MRGSEQQLAACDSFKKKTTKKESGGGGGGLSSSNPIERVQEGSRLRLIGEGAVRNKFNRRVACAHSAQQQIEEMSDGGHHFSSFHLFFKIKKKR